MKHRKLWGTIAFILFLSGLILGNLFSFLLMGVAIVIMWKMDLFNDKDVVFGDSIDGEYYKLMDTEDEAEAPTYNTRGLKPYPIHKERSRTHIRTGTLIATGMTNRNRRTQHRRTS